MCGGTWNPSLKKLLCDLSTNARKHSNFAYKWLYFGVPACFSFNHLSHPVPLVNHEIWWGLLRVQAYDMTIALQRYQGWGCILNDSVYNMWLTQQNFENHPGSSFHSIHRLSFTGLQLVLNLFTYYVQASGWKDWLVCHTQNVDRAPFLYDVCICWQVLTGLCGTGKTSLARIFTRHAQSKGYFQDGILHINARNDISLHASTLELAVSTTMCNFHHHERLSSVHDSIIIIINLPEKHTTWLLDRRTIAQCAVVELCEQLLPF